MSHTNLQHRRTHNLLLLSKLLNNTTATSPLTLIQDTLEQPAKRLLREYLRRAKLAKTSVVFVSFETLVKPESVDLFVEGYRHADGKGMERIAREVQAFVSRDGGSKRMDSPISIVIFDGTISTVIEKFY